MFSAPNPRRFCFSMFYFFCSFRIVKRPADASNRPIWNPLLCHNWIFVTQFALCMMPYDCRSAVNSLGFWKTLNNAFLLLICCTKLTKRRTEGAYRPFNGSLASSWLSSLACDQKQLWCDVTPDTDRDKAHTHTWLSGLAYLCVCACVRACVSVWT